MLAVSCVWALYGSVVTWFFIVIDAIPAITHDPVDDYLPSARDVVRGGIFAVLALLLPTIFLIFYSRQRVRATCLAKEDGGQAGAGRA
jgi:hypothetical protein